MEIEFTFWYLYCFLHFAEIVRLHISAFYATVIGQARVTICDFFGFGHLDGLGSRGPEGGGGGDRQTILILTFLGGPKECWGA